MDEFDISQIVPPEWTGATAAQRIALWPVINWVMQIYVKPVAEPRGDPDFLALRYQLLPRVPAVGEDVIVPGYRASIDKVTWGEDGRVTVGIAAAVVDAAYLDELASAGWTVFPRHDADAWFNG